MKIASYKQALLSLTTFTVASLSYFSAVCQYYFYNEDYYEPNVIWQTGLSVGGMNCLTDLGGKQRAGARFVGDINWVNTRWCGSLFVGATYKSLLGARLELAFGQVHATDELLKNDISAAHGRYLRNLHFKSGIRELSLLFEIFPITLCRGPDAQLPLVTTYVVAGIGYFSFSPEARYNGNWIPLASLRTEGQAFDEYPDRKLYKLQQLNLPIGFGCRYEISPLINFGLEIMYRKLWTDYLDDVSRQYIEPNVFQQNFSTAKAQLATSLADRRRKIGPGPAGQPGDIRGNPENNDSYFSGQVKFALTLGRQRR